MLFKICRRRFGSIPATVMANSPQQDAAVTVEADQPNSRIAQAVLPLLADAIKIPLHNQEECYCFY
jgi:hypothetical protein